MNQTKEDRRNMLAVRLGYHSESPETWPNEIIDRILDEAENLAERHIRDQVNCLGGKDASWHMDKK